MANIFMFAQPLAGWRRVAVREFKTKKDWVHEARILLEEDFPDAKNHFGLRRFQCCFFGAHSIGVLYDTFEPGLARSLARRLEIVPTPKHGSWLQYYFR